jgi:hypothetical protein
MKFYTLLTIFILVLTLTSAVSAVKPVDEEIIEEELFCKDAGFNCECQNFYNSSNYVAVEKFAMVGDEYKSDEVNPVYDYYDIDVEGNLQHINWTSNPDIYSVLVKMGNDRVALEGGSFGSYDSPRKDISHVTFCRMKTNGGCTGPNCGGNGVPEFPAYSIGAAVLVVTLGLVFLRRE